MFPTGWAPHGFKYVRSAELKPEYDSSHTIRTVLIGEGPSPSHLLPYYSKSHEFYNQRHGQEMYSHSSWDIHQNGCEAMSFDSIQRSTQGREKSLKANWKPGKLRNKHDVGVLDCFFILLSSLPVLAWSICGKFAVQEQGIGAMRGKKINRCKKRTKKHHRGGLASIYLTTTATIIIL